MSLALWEYCVPDTLGRLTNLSLLLVTSDLCAKNYLVTVTMSSLPYVGSDKVELRFAIDISVLLYFSQQASVSWVCYACESCI